MHAVPGPAFPPPSEQWTTEIAVHSTWSRDLYTILHGAAGVRQAELTLVINPLVRWIWLGGWLFLVGRAVRLWPAPTGGGATPRVARPKFLGLAHTQSRRVRV